jgi:hypothetical protein
LIAESAPELITSTPRRPATSIPFLPHRRLNELRCLRFCTAELVNTENTPFLLFDRNRTNVRVENRNQRKLPQRPDVGQSRYSATVPSDYLISY